MKRFWIGMACLMAGCMQQGKPKVVFDSVSETRQIEAITLLGDTLFTERALPSKALDKYEAAKLDYESAPESVENLIWYGRRCAYLKHFNKAIGIYTEGISKFPDDARLYRHRGHRYLSTRQYDKAVSDFEKAALLMEGKSDQVEPDGLPNAQNIPISSLKGNIWYHLGLAHYLQGNYDKALSVFSKRSETNQFDDNLVSGGHWMYMILKRMGRSEDAAEILAPIHEDLDIIENTNYHTICLFYKEVIGMDQITIRGDGSSSDDVFLYGLGNWQLYEQKDTVAAKTYFKRLLNEGNPYSFAYLVAESDWKRLFESP
ncbi:MAG: tetratricopeptide repeat protein [Flavobacteriaceae bacterium]|nr:tetratricopeptide repeat protein [Flavobacteriaceae bacterium]